MKLILNIALTLSYICLLRSGMAFAQENTTYLPMYLELADGDTLSGPGYLDLANDIVQIQRDGLKTFSAAQVFMVTVHFPEQRFRKVYYTFPYAAYSDYKKPKLFEMLFSGKYLSLLCRETQTTEMEPVFDAFTNRTFFVPRQRINEEYYFMWNDGDKILKYNNSKRELLLHMRDKQSEIKKFINDHKLKLNRKADLIQIVEQYNKLKAGLK